MMTIHYLISYYGTWGWVFTMAVAFIRAIVKLYVVQSQCYPRYIPMPENLFHVWILRLKYGAPVQNQFERKEYECDNPVIRGLHNALYSVRLTDIKCVNIRKLDDIMMATFS